LHLATDDPESNSAYSEITFCRMEPEMTNGATAAAAYAMEAIKASGVLLRVGANSFDEILRKSDSPLVVTSEGWLFGKKYHYLTSYKGFCFYARSPQPLQLPARAEVVNAAKIWMPA
jgi:hypothetical protein